MFFKLLIQLKVTRHCGQTTWDFSKFLVPCQFSTISWNPCLRNGPKNMSHFTFDRLVFEKWLRFLWIDANSFHTQKRVYGSVFNRDHHQLLCHIYQNVCKISRPGYVWNLKWNFQLDGKMNEWYKVNWSVFFFFQNKKKI